ncbi:hypothetical protein Tco_0778917 [Tanacetum coccineum]
MNRRVRMEEMEMEGTEEMGMSEMEYEQDRVERFIRGLPDNIQGNVIAANPARLQDAICIANQLMDKKLQGYAARNAENKRRMTRTRDLETIENSLMVVCVGFSPTTSNVQVDASDELYKFSDDTLTRLLSSLEDITKNIDMTYLPKRRLSNLEKKRANCMIKDINKLLKERRIMKNLEKFVGGRLYGTELRLLLRII